MSFLAVLILILSAFGAATISGFLGMAGGISLLGVMTAVMPPGGIVPIHGVVQLASNFTRVLMFLRHVYWRILLYYAGPAVLGMVFAVSLWSGEKLEWFKPGIGIFILLFLFWRRKAPRLRNVPLWVYAPVGFASGFLGIFVGATGPFMAPFFIRDDFKKEQVIATKAVCQAWMHLLKLPAFFSLGFSYQEHAGLIAALLVCVVAGTYTGKQLLKCVSKDRFIAIYEWVLGTIALYLVFAGLKFINF